MRVHDRNFGNEGYILRGLVCCLLLTLGDTAVSSFMMYKIVGIV